MADILKRLLVGCDLPKNQQTISSGLLPNISDTLKPCPIHVIDTTTNDTLGDKEISIRKAHGIKCYGEDIPLPITSFEHEMIPLSLQKKLKLMYGRPTPVQAQSLPFLLDQTKRDAIIVAPTGTGKTLVFLTTLLSILSKRSTKDDNHKKRDKRKRAIMLAPTKELAKQTEQELSKLKDSLSSQIMITTPLRLVRMIESGLDVSKVKQLVLDEADRLLEGSFLGQLDTILQAILLASYFKAIESENKKTEKKTSKKGKKPRITLFSATIPSGVEDIARSFMSSDTARIVVGSPMGSLANIKQELLFVGQEEGKAMAIQNLFAKSDGTMTPPVMIFTETIERANKVHSLFKSLNISSEVMHAERTQEERDSIIEGFKSGRIWVLVTTDLLARGLDIPNVRLVLNYDFPLQTSTYIHRIGRTGRAGNHGHAITFFTLSDIGSLRIVSNVVKQSDQSVPQWIEELKDTRKERKKQVIGERKSREQLEKQTNERVFKVENMGKRAKRHTSPEE